MQHAAQSIKVSVVPVAGGATLSTNAAGAVAEIGRTQSEILERPQGYAVSAVIALRATAGSPYTSRLVSLVAFLDSPSPSVTVRVDGVELGAVPTVIQSGVPLNVVTRHRLEIDFLNGANPATTTFEIPLEFGTLAP